MSAVCNAPESCKAKWERRAFARGVCNARGGWGGGGRARDESALRVRVMQRCAKRERCARERRAKGRVCKGMGVQGMSVQSGGGGRGVECGPE